MRTLQGLNVVTVVSLEISNMATLNNVSFAALHLVVLGTGVAPAFRRRAQAVVSESDTEARQAA